MTRASLFALVTVLLSAIWLGPLPDLARQSFAAHMTMHMGVVALAAPLLALAMSGAARDPIPAPPKRERGGGRRMPWLAAPILASVVEMVIVWRWHAPAMHHTARQHAWALALEQGSFLVAGLLLWIAAIGGDPEQRRRSAGTGVVALLFTSMHMTLLGALLALANRPLFQHAGIAEPIALADQQLGGAIMLLAGGTSYLVGGLCLTARMLRVEQPLAGRASPKRLREGGPESVS